MASARSTSRLSQIDLNLLRVLVVVDKERSLTKAAAVLSVSQSAVSHALSRLREHLGDPLFLRHGRNVTPTAFALQLAPVVRDALVGVEQAMARREGFDPRAGLSRVRLAMSEELEPLLVPALHGVLRAEVPSIALTSTRVDRASLRTDLVGRRVDVALDVARPSGDELAHERVIDDEFCVVAQRHRRKLDRQTYIDLEHVVVSSRPRGPLLEDFSLDRLGIRRKIAIRCQSYDTACRAVAKYDLLLTVPRRFAEARGVGRDLLLLNPPVRLPRVEIRQYWAHALDGDPTIRWIRAKVTEAVEAARGATS
jgi:DNA-binding transcriptional LysR family regulator